MKKEKHENQELSEKTAILTKLKLINLVKYLVYFFDRIVCLFSGKKTKNDSTNKKKVLILLKSIIVILLILKLIKF